MHLHNHVSCAGSTITRSGYHLGASAEISTSSCPMFGGTKPLTRPDQTLHGSRFTVHLTRCCTAAADDDKPDRGVQIVPLQCPITGRLSRQESIDRSMASLVLAFAFAFAFAFALACPNPLTNLPSTIRFADSQYTVEEVKVSPCGLRRHISAPMQIPLAAEDQVFVVHAFTSLLPSSSYYYPMFCHTIRDIGAADMQSEYPLHLSKRVGFFSLSYIFQCLSRRS